MPSTFRMNRARAALSAALAGAVVAGVVPLGLGPAQAVEPTPQPQPTAEFCADMPDDLDLFGDIAGNTFRHDISCLAWGGITTGVSPGVYGPGRAVTRRQMATFIARMMDTAWTLDVGDDIDELPDHDGADHFSDVRPGTTPTSVETFESVNRLAEAGIALGRTRDRFDPGAPVTRAQMATFVARATAHLRGLPPLDWAPDYFVDDGHLPGHQPNINAVALLGIATGVGAHRFDPDAEVTRAQMSAFLIRSLASLHTANLIFPMWYLLEMPDEELSSVVPTDNGDGTATVTFTLRSWLDEPVEGLVRDDFSLTNVDDSFNVEEELLTSRPTQWTFTEVGDGVYTLVYTSAVDTSFTVDIVNANHGVVAEHLTIAVTGAG